MYEIGRVYVWVECYTDPLILGTETTVIGPPNMVMCFLTQKMVCVQETTTNSIAGPGHIYASVGMLRPKNPPTGEKKIRSMFEPKPVMEVA